jgi:hypothetical protein
VSTGDELRLFQDTAARCLELLKSLFRDPARTKVTIVMRQAGVPDGSADVVIGDDDFRAAARAIEQQVERRAPAGAPKTLALAIVELVAAARREARSAALGTAYPLVVPDAHDELLAAVRNHLLAALDQVLAGPDAHALSLESAADRERLRELVASAVAHVTTARSA